jgi:hypothetical protein
MELFMAIDLLPTVVGVDTACNNHARREAFAALAAYGRSGPGGVRARTVTATV